MKVFDGCSEFMLDEWPDKLIVYVKTLLICLLVIQSKFVERHIFPATFQLLSSLNIPDFNWIQSLFWWIKLGFFIVFVLSVWFIQTSRNVWKLQNCKHPCIEWFSSWGLFASALFFFHLIRTLQLMKSILATLSHLSAPRNYNGAMNCLHSHFNISTHATLCVT